MPDRKFVLFYVQLSFLELFWFVIESEGVNVWYVIESEGVNVWYTFFILLNEDTFKTIEAIV